MKSLAFCASLLLTSCGAPAYADPLSALKSFTLSDVKTAESVYAANPTVPTYAAATECLGWLDNALSAPGAPINLGLQMPAGAISAVADLDVALSENGNVPPVVLAFNANCGGYIEDLKAEAASHAAPGLAVAGIKIIP